MRQMTKSLAVAILAAACMGSGLLAQDTADAAVRRVIQGLENNQAQVLWQALPASYQKDISDLIHEGAAKTDAQTWNAAFRVLGKLVRTLDEKSDFILQHPMVAGQLAAAQVQSVDSGYLAAVKMLGTLVNSEISQLDTLQRLDVEKFMAGTVSQIMSQADALAASIPGGQEGLENLRSSQVSLVSSDGDRAVVKIEDAEGAETRDMVRVEGKWVPAELAENWDARIAEVRDGIAGGALQDPAQNEQVLKILDTAEGALDQLLAANTAEDFNLAVGNLIGMMTAQFMSAPEGEQ